MQSLLGAIGGFAGVSEAVSKIEDYALKAGKTVYSAFKTALPYFADPKKGVPISISAVKLLSLAMVDVNGVTGKIDEFAGYLENLDLSVLLCGNQGCVEPPPPFYVDWGAINSQLPDLQCGFGDVGCYLQNGFRAIARAIAGAFYGLGTTLTYVGWTVLNWMVVVATRIAAFILRYIVGNIAKFVLTVWNGIIGSIRSMFCLYLTHVAPMMSVYQLGQDLVRGAKLVGVLDLVMPLMPIIFVANECGITGFSFTPPPPAPSPQPVSPSPTVPPEFSYPVWAKPVSVVEGVLTIAEARAAIRVFSVTEYIELKDYAIGV
jgi:hypothetical protein